MTNPLYAFKVGDQIHRETLIRPGCGFTFEPPRVIDRLVSEGYLYHHTHSDYETHLMTSEEATLFLTTDEISARSSGN